MKFFLFSFNSVLLKFSIFTLLITSIFLISACDQDSADGHDHDEEIHADVDGFLLQTSDNQEIYREFKGSTSGNILGHFRWLFLTEIPSVPHNTATI